MIREESQKKLEQEKLGESKVIYEQTPRPHGLWQVKVQMSDVLFCWYGRRWVMDTLHKPKFQSAPSNKNKPRSLLLNDRGLLIG